MCKCHAHSVSPLGKQQRCRVFIAALSSIAKNGKALTQCPLTGECINELQLISTVRHHTAVKINEPLPHATTARSFINRMLSGEESKLLYSLWYHL
jgi:hypothetical protein